MHRRALRTCLILLGATSGLLLVGCSARPTPASLSASGSHADDSSWVGDGTWRPIDSNEDPNQIIDQASTLLSDNITAADIGKSFGTDDAHIPYPDTYWPFVDNGIDHPWNTPAATNDAGASPADPSPLAKYMSVADPKNYGAAAAWEKNNHGSAVPGVADWFGHCPGWTGAAMQNAPILHPVFAKSDGDGGLQVCKAGDAGCVKFEIGDINALEAEVYVDATSSFIGGRCDTKPSDIKRDANGRIETGSCGGVNPGSLLIIAGNLMKKRQTAFAIDAQADFNTDQIWNQPAYRYHVYRFDTSLTEAQAANLVASGKKEGPKSSYAEFNASAKGWALVDLGIQWVAENGPNTEVVSGKDSTQETRVVAVIELDAQASDPKAHIIGGEYLDDASVGADRLTVPPFIWVASAPGPETLPLDSDGDSHNPYVKPSLVKQLIAMGQQK